MSLTLPDPQYPPNVSRETRERLDIHVRLLFAWQKAQNLVSPASLAQVWVRHVQDSAQIADLFPDAQRWLDIGSGAGFPGLTIALMLAERPGVSVTLVESNKRKTAFLRAVIRETGAPAQVVDKRIEDVQFEPDYPYEIITARALASLEKLCRMIAPHMGPKHAPFSTKVKILCLNSKLLLNIGGLIC